MMTDHYMFFNVCPSHVLVNQKGIAMPKCGRYFTDLLHFHPFSVNLWLPKCLYSTDTLCFANCTFMHLSPSPGLCTSYYINHSSCPLPSFKKQIDLGLLSAKCSFAVHRIFFSKFLFHMAKDRTYKFSKLYALSKATRGNFHASRQRLGDPPFGIFC